MEYARGDLSTRAARRGRASLARPAPRNAPRDLLHTSEMKLHDDFFCLNEAYHGFCLMFIYRFIYSILYKYILFPM